MCPDQPRGLNTVSSSVVQQFSSPESVTGRRLNRKDRFFLFFLLSSPVPGAPRNDCTILCATRGISDLRMFNMKQNTSDIA